MSDNIEQDGQLKAADDEMLSDNERIEQQRQKDFEALTHRAMERARLLVEGDADEILSDFAKENGFGHRFDDSDPLISVPTLFAAYLMEGKHPEGNDDPEIAIDFPIDHMNVLEVGGFNYEEEN